MKFVQANIWRPSIRLGSTVTELTETWKGLAKRDQDGESRRNHSQYTNQSVDKCGDRLRRERVADEV